MKLFNCMARNTNYYFPESAISLGGLQINSQSEELEIWSCHRDLESTSLSQRNTKWTSKVLLWHCPDVQIRILSAITLDLSQTLTLCWYYGPQKAIKEEGFQGKDWTLNTERGFPDQRSDRIATFEVTVFQLMQETLPLWCKAHLYVPWTKSAACLCWFTCLPEAEGKYKSSLTSEAYWRQQKLNKCGPLKGC